MNEELIGALEAVLFAIGEPIELSDLSECLHLDDDETKVLLSQLQKNCQEENRGIQLIQMKSKVQLCTKPEYHHYVDELITEKDKTVLSQAALETLSIVAYKQPVTRIEIERIRGVKSARTIQTLMDRTLIKEVGRLDAPGKPILYGTTTEFLKYSGITTLEELPAFEEFVEKVEE